MPSPLVGISIDAQLRIVSAAAVCCSFRTPLFHQYFQSKLCSCFAADELSKAGGSDRGGGQLH